MHTIVTINQIEPMNNVVHLSSQIIHLVITMRKLFVHSEAEARILTPDEMCDLFDPVLSPEGSNNREIEERVVMLWMQFIELIEGKTISEGVLIFLI